ncbi:alpha/beta fold hydrolase [Nonomuraea basaltis]|uniref:alpha/beta fold hydrolase n=1 Tax=Nonomuraea basaltis TaxID=2495887 RepID=UPI00110C605F|nr:alpha/beta hydrolase [Nonomuraea basaltis]TMR93787.1 alpha/beta hydrolase [Nonomuraea basaltis]
MYTHFNAPTKFVDVNGVRLAYRRFGADNGVPIVLLPHFRAGMDHWDPLLTDGLAAKRPVVLFDNVGIAASAGEVPDSIETMADDAAAFLRAIDLPLVDVLGFSLGGAVAQSLTLRHPESVRRLILLGTVPPNGDMADAHPDVPRVAVNPVPTVDDFLFLFFGSSPAAQEAGRAFWARRHQRTEDVDPPSSPQTIQAQAAAMEKWNTSPVDRDAELAKITQLTLVANGNRDVMLPTINSYILAQHIPNAQLVIYPDAGHGAQFQYPRLFLNDVTQFLDTEVPFS